METGDYTVDSIAVAVETGGEEISSFHIEGESLEQNNKEEIKKRH